METTDITKVARSKTFLVIIMTLFALALLAGAFSFGVVVGFHKARFSYDWGEHYDRNFGGPHHGIFGFREGTQFMDAHGIFGQTVKIDQSSLVLKGRDDIEKIVLVDNDTTIQRMREKVALMDLKVGDVLVVIGEPNDQGQIVARFIRVMP